jgi:hypothetical protein
MIVIDKATETTRLIFTLTEKTDVENPIYTLVLHSPYTNKTYSLELPANTSQYKERYDEFILDTEIFKDMESGSYYYSVLEGEPSEVIQIGLATIVQPNEPDFITVNESETTDDYIVYEN